MNEEKIKHFNDILFTAHEMALKAECEAHSNKNTITLATQLVLDNIILRNVENLQLLVKNSLIRGLRGEKNLPLQSMCHQRTLPH